MPVCPCIVCKNSNLDTINKTIQDEMTKTVHKYYMEAIKAIVTYGKEEDVCLYRIYWSLNLMYTEGHIPENKKEEKLLKKVTKALDNFGGDDPQIFNSISDCRKYESDKKGIVCV